MVLWSLFVLLLRFSSFKYDTLVFLFYSFGGVILYVQVPIAKNNQSGRSHVALGFEAQVMQVVIRFDNIV